MAALPEDQQATVEQLESLTLTWYPQQGGQRAFMACPFFEALAEGNRGGGKTDTLVMDFCQDVDQGFGPDWQGILFRRTYPELQDVISKSKKWIPLIWPSAKYNEAKSFWEFPGGERLYFRHFNKPDDYWSYHGHSYPWIGWEELCTWATDGGYRRMFSCVRSANPGVAKRARVRGTTNPYGVGHNWVKHRFRLPAWRSRPILDSKDLDGNDEPPRIAINVSLDDNQILLKADPKYKQRILAAARNDAEKRAWEQGDWNIVAGGMFDDVWDPRYNLVKPFRIPPSWRMDRTFDWGSSAPFSVGWWAESDGSDVLMADGQVHSTVRGDVYRIGEWYGWNGRPNEGLRLLNTEIATGIVERELATGWYGRVKPGVADTSIFTDEGGNCVATDMAKSVRINGRLYPGVRWNRADKTSRKQGWQQVREYLSGAHPNVQPDGSIRPREHPGLFVFTSCDQFQRTIPVLPRDDKDLDDVDTDAEDHIADEVRYKIRSLGRGARQGQRRGV
jgi:hypothetical protein